VELEALHLWDFTVWAQNFAFPQFFLPVGLEVLSFAVSGEDPGGYGAELPLALAKIEGESKLFPEPA
jgi:hypothetical protein